MLPPGAMPGGLRMPCVPETKETGMFNALTSESRSHGSVLSHRHGRKRSSASQSSNAGSQTKNLSAAKLKRACNRPEHNHSKIATDLFKAWFYANLEHPFPSDDVKADFADRTGLSFTQVTTWFVNARKRVWKPLLHESRRGRIEPNVGTAWSGESTEESDAETLAHTVEPSPLTCAQGRDAGASDTSTELAMIPPPPPPETSLAISIVPTPAPSATYAMEARLSGEKDGTDIFSFDTSSTASFCTSDTSEGFDDDEYQGLGLFQDFEPRWMTVLPFHQN